MFTYAGKTVLITGASSGIGEAFAYALAVRGCNLVLVARSEEKLRELARLLADNYRVQTVPIALDLSIEGAAEALLQEVLKRHIKVDLLINNAGFATHGHFDQLSGARQHKEVMLNVAALVDITHAFMPDLLQGQEGGVINVASTGAFQPLPYMAVYGATKAFVLSFSEALWSEYRNRGLRVLALCPGPTATRFFEVVGSNEAAVGKKQSADAVVQNALRAFEQGRSHIVSGRQNYWVSQIARITTRQFVANFVERLLRPRSL